MKFEILRDPLWNNIRVDELTLRLVDTEIFQRLRNVRQLGLAYLVYPGATHTRVEHALGAYHLARRTLGLLDAGGVLDAALAGSWARPPGMGPPSSGPPLSSTTSATIRSPTPWRRSARCTTKKSRV